MIGRGNQAQIDVDFFAPAQAGEGLLLDKAEQLRLHGQGDVTDFIQEERAAIGALDMAAAHGGRTSEGVFLVAEQFAFEELLGQGAAEQRDEGFCSLRAVGVNHASPGCMAGAAPLAADFHVYGLEWDHDAIQYYLVSGRKLPIWQTAWDVEAGNGAVAVVFLRGRWATDENLWSRRHCSCRTGRAGSVWPASAGRSRQQLPPITCRL
jgi:hypothetical protein